MRRKFSLALCLLVGGLLAGGPAPVAAPPGAAALNGRVALASGAPLAHLSVRLYFSREANRATLVSLTDNDGRFRFAGLDPGRYLLEVYRGDELLHQQVVTLTDGEQAINVRL